MSTNLNSNFIIVAAFAKSTKSANPKCDFIIVVYIYLLQILFIKVNIHIAIDFYPRNKATVSMLLVHGNWSTGVASMNSYPFAVRYLMSLASVPGSQDT